MEIADQLHVVIVSADIEVDVIFAQQWQQRTHPLLRGIVPPAMHARRIDRVMADDDSPMSVVLIIECLREPRHFFRRGRAAGNRTRKCKSDRL